MTNDFSTVLTSLSIYSESFTVSSSSMTSTVVFCGTQELQAPGIDIMHVGSQTRPLSHEGKASPVLSSKPSQTSPS